MKRNNSPADSPEENTLHNLAWVRREQVEGRLLREIALKVKRRRARRFAAGGTLLAVALIGSLAFGTRPKAPDAAVAASPPAGTATILRPASRTLPDGSTVSLKDDARILVDYSAEVRRVTLVSGEAHFQVASNVDRPFIVRAGRAEVRAVGTAFSVQIMTQAVEVLVTEGSVRVGPQTSLEGASPALATPASAALVEAGRRCRIDSGMLPLVDTMSAVDLDQRLGWRIPQLEFSRPPLPEIVALLNQQTALTQAASLQIAAPEFNHIKLTGTLRADNVEGLIRLLEKNFNVVADRSGREFVLRKAETEKEP